MKRRRCGEIVKASKIQESDTRQFHVEVLPNNLIEYEIFTQRVTLQKRYQNVTRISLQI